MAFPIAETEIIKTEQKMGIRFPESFRQAMILSNGGELSTGEDDWLIHPFLDTTDRKRFSRTSNDITRETAQARQWAGFPQDSVAIANNGSGDFLVLNPSLENSAILDAKVYLFRHDTRTLEQVANDFSELSE